MGDPNHNALMESALEPLKPNVRIIVLLPDRWRVPSCLLIWKVGTTVSDCTQHWTISVLTSLNNAIFRTSFCSTRRGEAHFEDADELTAAISVATR